MNLEALSSSIPMNTTDHGEGSNLGTGVVISTVLGACTLILVVTVILLLLIYTRRKRRVNKTK